MIEKKTVCQIVEEWLEGKDYLMVVALEKINPAGYRNINLVADMLKAEIIKDLRKLKDNENVKAVVLRVNSPGGSAYGSAEKGVIVSICRNCLC